jgi:hypothetical protein
VDGLEAGDNINDLQRKLSALPSDLKALCRIMFQQQPAEYRMQANEMFRLCSEWNNFTNGESMSAITFSCAIKPYRKAFDSPIALFDYDDFDMAVKTVAARIRSRCCGLLEVRRKNHRPKVDSHGMFNGRMGFLQESSVQYLHRTVAEFITSDDVWKDICDSTHKSGLQPILHIASACLLMMKRARYFDDVSLHRHLEYWLWLAAKRL